MFTVRLPDPVEQRLAALARKTGRTKATLARQAILEYIGDLEDFYLAEARARKNRKTIPLDEAVASLARIVEFDRIQLKI